jgi:Holliday junction resolvase RusA-like endonuclease
MARMGRFRNEAEGLLPVTSGLADIYEKEAGQASITYSPAFAREVHVLTMPLPPSVNEAYRNVPGRGRVLTGAANEWKRLARRHLLYDHKLKPAKERRGQTQWTLEMHIFFKNWLRDIDNVNKLTIDLLDDYLGLQDNRLMAVDERKYVRPGKATGLVAVVRVF